MHFTVRVPISFFDTYYPSKRHKHPHTICLTGEVEITIPQLEKSDAPIAMVVCEKEYDPETIHVVLRWWRKKLWTPVRIGFRTEEGAKTKRLSTDDLVQELQQKNRAVDSLDAAVQAKRREASQYAIIGGTPYVQVEEPRYVVVTFGLGNNHGGTGLFVEQYYNGNIRPEAYFNALQREEAVAYGKNIARMRGDTKHISSIGRYCNIQVLLPEAVRLQPKKDYPYRR